MIQNLGITANGAPTIGHVTIDHEPIGPLTNGSLQIKTHKNFNGQSV